MTTKFAWRGVPITDIHAWAANRGERMVKYVAVRYVPSIFLGVLVKEEKVGEMPESFWDHLIMTDGWSYEEIR